MSELLVSVDVEALVVTYLSDALESLGATVATKVPNPRPDKSVRVTRVGGPRANMVTDRPMVLVECWSADETDACDLARYAHAHIWLLEQSTVDGVWVRRVGETGGIQNSPDPDSGSARYQFVMSLDIRPSLEVA